MLFKIDFLEVKPHADSKFNLRHIDLRLRRRYNRRRRIRPCALCQGRNKKAQKTQLKNCKQKQACFFTCLFLFSVKTKF